MARRKSHTFAWSPLRKLMRSEKAGGAEIVSRDAVALLMSFLEERAKKLTDAAIKFAKHSKRKKISKADMEMAIQFA